MRPPTVDRSVIARVAALAAARAPARRRRGAGPARRRPGYVSTFSRAEAAVLGPTSLSRRRDRSSSATTPARPSSSTATRASRSCASRATGVYENPRRRRYVPRPRARCPRLPTLTRSRGWRKVARSASYTWHDHRILWVGKEPPPTSRRRPTSRTSSSAGRSRATADGEAVRDHRLPRLGPAAERAGRRPEHVADRARRRRGAVCAAAGGGWVGVRRARRRTPVAPVHVDGVTDRADVAPPTGFGPVDAVDPPFAGPLTTGVQRRVGRRCSPPRPGP